MKKKKPEILAPVGGQEQLFAAVRLGADAVYFGLQNFNARRNAENFGGDNVSDTIEYCHEHDCNVNITINTLVCDNEIKDMHKAVDMAVSAGADALIIQDFAVAKYVKDTYPNMHMHASTQMAVHNSEGVKILRDYGFSQFVLARELSLDEIKKIYDETGADLEVFVHGAHCMCVSGNCYLSSMIGGRSGNRGLCAQPCRLEWHLNDKDHALSLKDLSYIQYINDLADAGVKTLKIEGRMKRPEYVAEAVRQCKLAIGGGEVDTSNLKAIFSRSGFTAGYLEGKCNADMFGYRTKEDVTAAEDVLPKIAKLYEKEPQSISVDMMLYAIENDNSQLTVSDG
ncbi:MAG: peptidase U32 family protein, partial [Bacillota bacterium]|nr:peptidase U32 family protein [Bacillota bacterium]